MTLPDPTTPVNNATSETKTAPDAANPLEPFKLVIASFRGDYHFLSNFFIDSYPIMYNGTHFMTAEHLYQWGKTENPRHKGRIQAAQSPAEARRLGRAAGMVPASWDLGGKFRWMRLVVALKFTQRPAMTNLLLGTGDATLIEGNTWGDMTWGAVNFHGEWVGDNQLGKILMELRTYLRG